MYANAWPSEAGGTAAPALAPLRQRVLGRVMLEAARFGTVTRPVRIAESGSMRVRLPNAVGAGLDACLVNTAGGVACGDRFDIEVAAGAGAQVTVATPAAEKVYRSDGPVAELNVALRLEAGAALDWLPQETILFDTARLSRRLDVEMAPDARLTLFEAVQFGRAARGESVNEGFFTDRWRIRRGGRLAYADTLRLDGPIAPLLARPAVGNGARALATFLHVAPNAETRLEATRAMLPDVDGCEIAASAWNGLVAVRLCATSIESLRRAAIPFLVMFRGVALPRVWLS